MHPSSAAPSSEFALPTRARALVARINQDVMEVATARLSAAAKTREARLAAATSRFASDTKRLEATKAQHRKAFDEQQTEARNLLQSLKSLTKVADAAMERLGWDTYATRRIEGAPPASAPRALPREAVDELGKASLALQNLKKPRLWPEHVAAAWALGIALLIALVNFPPLVLLWPAVYFLVLHFTAKDTREEHRRISERSEELQKAVEAWQKQAAIGLAAANKDAETKVDLPARRLFAQESEEATGEYAACVAALHFDLTGVVVSLHADIAALRADAGYAVLPWNAEAWTQWEPDTSPEFAGQIGEVIVTPGETVIEALTGLPLVFSLPALVPFADGTCLLLDAPAEARQQASEALHSVVIRALASTPPGKARFVFIDPVGLGQNVADFMSLADHDKDLIGGKAWSEPRHIDEQLGELSEHMETVIQKYLRREFETILDYNAQAKEVAEPFRFLVVFDYPVNFTPEAARRLASIVRNGARCGVFTFIHRDRSKALPYGVSAEDLELAATRIAWASQRDVRWLDPDFGTGLVIPDSVKDQHELITRMISVSGASAVAAKKVEVPFERLIEGTEDSWTSATSARTLSVPMGPSGRKLQYLTLGQGLAHHALIVGRTGSGKTNLMHVIITGLALKYSPRELELFLIDFKGGVSFKPYATHALPHARVIAIESDREFGISVLQGLDQTLKERFDRFRAAGADNLIDYRVKRLDESVPRIVLIIDEYQEFFSTEDRIAEQARTILERMVRQGRSFGIHVMLASQSLSGTSQLPQSVLGQLAVRIALPCNQADAYEIFTKDNGAARTLSRPGEAIYNDAGGIVEANNPFQAALFTDADLQKQLEVIRTRAASLRESRPIYVFEGSEPAAIEECPPLNAIVAARQWRDATIPKVWLGEPLAMQPPVEAVFHAKPGRNLLIVTRDEAQGVGLVHAVWGALLSQHRPTTARFYVLDLSTSGEPWTERTDLFRETFAHQIERLSRRDLPRVLGELKQMVNDNLDRGPGRHRVFLNIVGLHRARDLRIDDETRYKADVESNASIFAELLRDGPEAGVHTLAWCDSVTSARRTLERAFDEFGLRVAGEMSAEDSDTLLDSPAAAQLNRPHRMLYFDEERPGVLPKFRPYALPTLEWLQSLAAQQRQWRQEETGV